MTLVGRECDMTVTDLDHKVADCTWFNQFILIDQEQRIVTLECRDI